LTLNLSGSRRLKDLCLIEAGLRVVVVIADGKVTDEMDMLRSTRPLKKIKLDAFHWCL